MVGAAALCLGAFALATCAVVVRRARALFLPRHGRRHRVCGLLYLCWLAVGVGECVAGFRPTAARAVAFDVALGALGVLATASAAADFGRVAASATSGTLDADATVTRSEMVEHAFYQGLNVAQVVGLHAAASARAQRARWAVLAFQTAPWLARARFPVNSFSANYDAARGGSSPWTLPNVLYRVKKYQYVFYKHALLHGLNVSTCLAARPVRPASRAFRVYWLSLNAAYTHEFFLQTLVKKKMLRQSAMLALNGLLMAGSSAAAARVLVDHVRWPVAAASWALNLAHRHHDFANTVAVALAAAGWARF